jgi:hypothetical protein
VFSRSTRRKTSNIDLACRHRSDEGRREGGHAYSRQSRSQPCPCPQLGFSDDNLAKYRECMRQPYGMILHCGPTGSGKSMTLYAALGESEHARRQHPDRRRPHRIHAPRHQPDADEPADRPGPSNARCAVTSVWIPTSSSWAKSATRRPPRSPARRRSPVTYSYPRCTRTTRPPRFPVSVKWASSLSIFPPSLVCVCAQRLLRRVCKNCKLPYEPKGREEPKSSCKALDLTERPDFQGQRPVAAPRLQRHRLQGPRRYSRIDDQLRGSARRRPSTKKSKSPS